MTRSRGRRRGKRGRRRASKEPSGPRSTVNVDRPVAGSIVHHITQPFICCCSCCAQYPHYFAFGLACCASVTLHLAQPVVVVTMLVDTGCVDAGLKDRGRKEGRKNGGAALSYGRTSIIPSPHHQVQVSASPDFQNSTVPPRRKHRYGYKRRHLEEVGKGRYSTHGAGIQ